MKRSPERYQFLLDIITGAVEGGFSSDWFTFSQVIRDEELNIVSMMVSEDDNDYEDGSPSRYFPVNADVIAKGLALMLGEKGKKTYDNQEAIALAARKNDSCEGNLDAIDYDAILQMAVLGEVKYG